MFRAAALSCAGLLLASPVVAAPWPYEDGYPYTTTDPISDFGMYTQDLYATITYIVCVIFVLVSLLLGYTLYRYRDDGSEGNPEQIHGNAQMEIAWTLLPVVIVLFLIVPTIRTIFIIGSSAPEGARDEAGQVILAEDGSPEKPTVEVEVIGKRWWWEFKYVGTDVVTGNHFAIPDDRPVSMLITSDTVIHSFWIPRIGGKRDAIPGRINSMWFSLKGHFDVPAGEVEHIRGECAEYCGEAHSMMRFETVALDGPDFDKWMAQYTAGATDLDNTVKSKGEAAFTAAGCAGCHAIRGNDGANGNKGPDLTFFGDRRYLAAGVEDMYPQGAETPVETTRETLKTWITNPNSIKPGTTQSANPTRVMDGMNVPVDKNGDGILTEDELSAEQLDAIVDYLLAQKSSYPISPNL